MNNPYIISKDEAIRRLDDTGPIEAGLEVAGIDTSLPLVLDDSDRKKGVERRCHKRFRLIKQAYALIRSISEGPLEIGGKSMGCIACAVFNAKPAKLGIIDNISMGGLTFQHVDSRVKLDNKFVLDILLADCGFYLADIPFKIITDFEIPDDILGDSVVMRQVRLQFQKLNANLKAKLKDFILNHGVEIGEIGNKV